MVTLNRNKRSCVVLPVFIAMVLMLLGSCSEEVDESIAIKDYFNKDIASLRSSNRVSAYFDLSDGVVLAYKRNVSAADFLNRVVQKITAGEDCDVYSLAADSITALKLKQTELYNKIIDEFSYNQQMAPIEKTLDKIVSEGKASLLVTDFEEFTPDKRVQHQAFATRYFVKWLNQGNDITFFVFDFIGVKKIPYHLYFIIFDNKKHELLRSIKETVRGVKDCREFHLARDAYEAMTEYPSSTKGGNYHDESGLDVVTAVPEDGSLIAYKSLGEGLKAEFYPVGEQWRNVLTNSKAMSEAGVQPKFTHLFRHLFFDFSNTDSYIIEKLKLKVTNVQDDFVKYTQYRTALAAGKDDLDFYDENGKLLPEFDYKKSPGRVVEVNDLFELDQELFKKSLEQSRGKKTEIGIMFSPIFKGDVIGAQTGDLLRVDVCVDKARPNSEQNLTEIFSWGQNTNLRDAVRNTLQELNPQGTIIYTYFLREL